MAGGEGGVHRRRDQQGDGGVDGEGPHPADERLEGEVATPQATQVPSFLVFGIASRIAASKIHTSPWSQIRLTGTMTASRTPQRR